MSSRPSLLVIVCLVLVAAVLLTGGNPLNAQTDAATEKSIQPAVPYIAEVVGTDVYMRSGAGTAHYYCGKINAPQRVTVVKNLPGWSEIIPPNGTFSWISKDFVDLGKINPSIGLVNGNGVRVWAGSDYVEPMRSISLQVKLNKGDIVKLVEAGSQKDEYYKIVPPPGAHLWISSQLLKYVGPLSRPKPMIPPDPNVEEKPVIIIPKPKEEVKTEPDVKTESDVGPEEKVVVEPETETKTIEVPKPKDIYPKDIEPETTNVNTTTLSTEVQRVKECYDIAEKIGLELAKPLDVQKFNEFKMTLTAILNDNGAGKAQRYAEFQLSQIKRFELARTAGDELKSQDAKLQMIRQKIREKRAARIAEIPDRGRHIVSGTFKPSLVFTTGAGQKRYKILNEFEKIVCYAVPAGSAARMDLSRFEGHKVGLKGTIVSDRTNPIGLVMFNVIEDLTVAIAP